jgi:hypothetical protein
MGAEGSIGTETNLKSRSHYGPGERKWPRFILAKMRDKVWWGYLGSGREMMEAMNSPKEVGAYKTNI